MNGNGKKSAALLEIIRERCTRAPITYRDFIDCALYHPGLGYYRRDTGRVGRAPGRDFYTAESLGPVFARLVAAAAKALLGPRESEQTCFIEIGAEPGHDLLSTLDEHPFAGTRTLRPGDLIDPSGRCVVFANEWLDALPFHRIVFRTGSWRERGVRARKDGRLEEVLLESPSPAVAGLLDRLPHPAPEGYEMDLPIDAKKALAALATRDWNGLLLLFDYGKAWDVLATGTPQGTARAFYRHRRESDLLARPGEQDITCDLCWDWLENELREAGFLTIALDSQEAFLVRHAAEEAQAIVNRAAGSFSRERQTLMELIHPSHMGQRFQVLHARRP